MELTLLLARHGQTDWNRERRLQGQSDPPLNELGRGHAHALAETLGDETISRALLSPLLRARQTAEAISLLRPDLKFEVEPRIAELSLGEWEGRLESEMMEDPAYKAWRADPVLNTPPGGEGALEVARRVAPLLDELAISPPGSSILILGHQFTNAVIRCLVTGVPLDQLRSLYAGPGELQRVTLHRRQRGG